MSTNRRPCVKRRATSAPEKRILAHTSYALKHIDKSRHLNRRTRSLDRYQTSQRKSRNSDFKKLLCKRLKIWINRKEMECEAELKRFQKMVQGCHEKLTNLLKNASDASSSVGTGKQNKFPKTMKESREILKQLLRDVDIQLKPTISKIVADVSTNLSNLHKILQLRQPHLNLIKSDLKIMIYLINSTLPDFAFLASSKMGRRDLMKAINVIKPTFIQTKLSWEKLDNIWTAFLKKQNTEGTRVYDS